LIDAIYCHYYVNAFQWILTYSLMMFIHWKMITVISHSPFDIYFYILYFFKYPKLWNIFKMIILKLFIVLYCYNLKIFNTSIFFLLIYLSNSILFFFFSIKFFTKIKKKKKSIFIVYLYPTDITYIVPSLLFSDLT